MDRFFSIDTAVVVSDIIDGEAIMLHRGSGDYFSADGVGCLIWQGIGEGQSRGRILDRLNARFAGRAEIETTLDTFLAELAAHDLVREIADGVPPAVEAAIEPPTERASEPGHPFRPPVLHVYSDIRNLLMLDPLHDVAEMAGWPTPKRTDAAS